MDQTPMHRVAAASAIGTILEWYDFALYNAMAGLVFNKIFFPSFDPLVGTLLAFLTMASAWSRARWAALFAGGLAILSAVGRC
jgi:hypothetical protein